MNMENTAPMFLDIEKPGSLAFSVPVSYRFYRHSRVDVNSWKELYGGIIRYICIKFASSNQKSIIEETFPIGEIGDIKASKDMKAPYCITRGVYIETGLSSDSIIRRIKTVLSVCKIDFSKLSIEYYIDEEKKSRYLAQREKSFLTPKYPKLNWDYNCSYVGAVPISFKYKSRRTRLVKTWTSLYICVISILSEEYPKVIKDGIAFGTGKRIDICRSNRRNIDMKHPVSIGNGLLLESFGGSNQLINRIYSALALCKVDPKELVIFFTFKEIERDLQYLGKKTPRESPLEKEYKLDDILVRRLRFILTKFFPDGYRIDSSIERNRLYAYYEKQYKEELPLSEENVDTILYSLYKPIGDRILVKTQAEIGELMKEVSERIVEAFLDGATVIYSVQLMTIYHNDLSRMGIHDISTFEGLLDETLGNEYRIQNNRIYFGRRKQDISTEIKRILKKSEKTLSLEELSSRVWYCPEAIIERYLLNANDVVCVSPQNFYFAPNLPIKKAESALIESTLRATLIVQHTMTDLELLDAVLQICPQLLSEVSFLTWKALKGSLGYIFRNTIDIDDYHIVLRKG